MIFYPDKILHRYTYTQSGEGVYGEPVSKYEYNGDILVDFQNENNNEVAKNYGVELSNLYKIYMDVNVKLDSTDELRDDDGNIYTIIGKIMDYTHFHNYRLAHIILDRHDSNRGG